MKSLKFHLNFKVGIVIKLFYLAMNQGFIEIKH